MLWDSPNERYYEHGLDRGVIYPSNRDPMPWNGLTGLDEGGEGGTTAMLYRDGQIYLGDVEPSDFTASMTAIYYPDAFGYCLGIPEATDGLFLDNQKPKRFHLSYRSLIGSGLRGDRFGYQLHLVYNCMASIGNRARRTIGKETAPVDFNFDLVCTPVKLPGFRPTAHYIIDTRGMSKSKVAEIEAILYGSGETPGRMPEPLELFDLMNYGDAIVFKVHNDGTYTVEGSNDNVFATGPHTFMMKNINATDNGDGTYTVEDGGNTDVIIE